MKKILLILSFFSSFVFADCYYSSIDSQYVEVSNNTPCYRVYNGNVQIRTAINYSSQSGALNISVAQGGIVSESSNTYTYNVLVQWRASTPSTFKEVHYTVRYSSSSDCIASNVVNGICVDCTESDSQNEDCTCKSGYEPFLDSGGNQEGCQAICEPNSIVFPSDDWIDLNFTDSDMCTNYLIEKEIDGTFISQDDGCGGTVSACFGQSKSPCDDLLSPIVLRPRGGYIYKGRVDNSSICASYVKGIDYIDSKVRAVDDDCSKNNDYYCYLLPINTDDNQTNQDSEIPLQNEDGTIPNDLNSSLSYNPDNNFSDSQLLNNQLLQDLKTNIDNSNINNSLDNTKLLNAQNETTSAINNQNSNLASKLDTINQSINDLNITADMSLTNDILKNALTSDYDFSLSTELDTLDEGWTSWKETYNNAMSDYDNLELQFTTLKELFTGNALTTILTKKEVSSCNKSFDFYINSNLTKEINIDPCIAFSQSRGYMYTFSYLLFTIGFISLLFSLLTRD